MITMTKGVNVKYKKLKELKIILKSFFPGTGKASNPCLYPGTQKSNTRRRVRFFFITLISNYRTVNIT